jgi:hypothetical protein
MARTKADEQAAVQTSTAAEQEAIMEAQSQAEAQGTRGIQGDNAKALDFYSALYNGVST